MHASFPFPSSRVCRFEEIALAFVVFLIVASVHRSGIDNHGVLFELADRLCGEYTNF